MTILLFFQFRKCGFTYKDRWLSWMLYRYEGDERGKLKEFSESLTLPQVAQYQKACRYAFSKMQTSIVSGSISAAISGEYGDVKITERTGSTKLWINPLMVRMLAFKNNILVSILVLYLRPCHSKPTRYGQDKANINQWRTYEVHLYTTRKIDNTREARVASVTSTTVLQL
jgi:hypothetical protein